MSENTKCCKCGCDGKHEDYLYNYDDELYCFDCLEFQLEAEGSIQTSITTNYFTREGDYLGNDDDTWDLMMEVCEAFDIEKIEIF